MKVLLIGLIAVGAVAALYCGCSKEDRDEMINRVTKAAKGLNGEVIDNTKEHETPTIVAEQQKKERIRQNTKWTAENQRLHPIEYCQAQLEETVKLGKNLEVQQHKLLTVKSSLSKKVAQLEAQVTELSGFLEKAKAAYKEADMVNGFPITLNGHSVTKEQAQPLMLEASRKLKKAKEQLAPSQTSLAQVERNLTKVSAEQEKLVALREKLKTTMESVRLKKVVEGGEGMSDALQAIDDSMNALQQVSEIPEPSALETIMTPDKGSKDASDFADLLKD